MPFVKNIRKRIYSGKHQLIITGCVGVGDDSIVCVSTVRSGLMYIPYIKMLLNFFEFRAVV